MGATLSEKILARCAGGRRLKAGDHAACRVDRILATDITAPLAIEAFRKMGASAVFDKSSCILVNDHFVPAKDIESAGLSRAMRMFAREQGIERYFEVGRSGICHILIAESCLVLPGQLLIGADSHTCTAGALGCFAAGVGSTDLAAAWALGEIWLRVPETIQVHITGSLPPFVGAKDLILHVTGVLGVEGARYRALEFCGGTVAGLAMAGRATLCNMAAEMGAKAAMVVPDETTERYVREKTSAPFDPVLPDADAGYERSLLVDASSLEPLVAEPPLPSNVRGVGQFAGVKVDQVFIGSCTNGFLEDLRAAASLLKGRKISPDVRCVVTPGSQRVFLDAAREGLLADFVEAGAAVTTPTCGACLGGHMGVLADGEVALATTSRNFRGRMGHPGSRVYLSGPAVAAATAVTGTITHPGELA